MNIIYSAPESSLHQRITTGQKIKSAVKKRGTELGFIRLKNGFNFVSKVSNKLSKLTCLIIKPLHLPGQAQAGTRPVKLQVLLHIV